jgi:hypothetical protein
VYSNYAGAVLGPLLVIAAGLGLLFVPATLVAMSRVADKESGVAARKAVLLPMRTRWPGEV